MRRVVEPLLAGSDGRASARVLEYVRDPRLVARDPPPRIANPVHAEVVPRELTSAVQEKLTPKTARYVRADGGLDVVKLLGAFQEFFREQSEHRIERFRYREACPQLLLQAFCQRIVNGGGRAEREWGSVGSGWTCCCPGRRASGGGSSWWSAKPLHNGPDRTVRAGLEQTAGHMDRCGAEAGRLVVFDRGSDKPWAEKVQQREEAAPDGPTITVRGM